MIRTKPVRHATAPSDRVVSLEPAGTDRSDAALADLLAAAAEGDTDAFMRFYDCTSGYAYALEMQRARGRNLRTPARRIRVLAEEATARRFVEAWRHAADQCTSGRSPLAWLLTLPVAARGQEPAGADEDEAACA